jgi:DNA-binding transcriptional MerR regulator
MTEHRLTIGKLAARSGCKAQTIRYYEQIGLLPTPLRSIGNHRIYGLEHVRRLIFIRHSRELGFHLDAIRELLACSDNSDSSCQEVTQIAQKHLQEVNSWIARLSSFKSELEHMIAQCPGRQISTCHIIGRLQEQNSRMSDQIASHLS